VVRLNRRLNGSVSHAGRCWNVQIQLDGNCIHAVVNDPEFCSESIWGVRRLTAAEHREPSAEVRKFATAAIAARLALPVADLRIVRSDRIPRLIVGDSAPFADLSLSHHGSYVGFACRIGSRQSVLH
jgi:hypothetical protein